jgi:hypothetical protein
LKRLLFGGGFVGQAGAVIVAAGIAAQHRLPSGFRLRRDFIGAGLRPGVVDRTI